MSKFFKTKFVKKVIVLFSISIMLFSCSNEPTNSTTEQKSTKNESIKAELKLDKFTNTPKFCIAELLELLKHNPNEYENHVLSKGYQFMKSEDNEDWGTYYEFNYPNVSNKIYGSIYHVFNDGFQSPNSVNWSTFDSKEYLELKSETEKLGFEYWNTSEIYNGKASSYKNDSLIVTFLMETKQGKTIYVVEVRCLPVKTKKQ